MVMAGSAAAVIATVLAVRKTTPASAEPVVAGAEHSFFSLGNSRKLSSELQSTRGELTLARAQMERANKIMGYSNTYEVTAGMATSVFDASLREGIDPDLAFRLVRVESQFNPRAVSKVGAVGLTQLMPSTAKLLQTGVTREQLFNRDTNLRLGFHFLRGLLDLYDGNLHLALLAYNRGEDAVTRDVRAGVNPGNGYDRSVIGSYKGDGNSP
jgi:soluble lytic murein transglycosylase-like protein